MKSFITDKKAMNIIVCHTPVVSTSVISKVYEPLVKYGVNIFAFDFSGSGKSKDSRKCISKESIMEDFDCIIDYIKRNFSDDIYIYGSAGIGGIFAQYYVSDRNNIKGFAQFSCLTFQETKSLGYPLFLVKAICPILRVLPNIKITMKPPKYKGYHENEDNQFYTDMLVHNPNFWKTDSKFLLTLLEMAVDKNSFLQKRIKVPTLVFKTMYDRYFSRNHFNDYFKQLACEKRMITIEDTHNSYYNQSELFCEYIYDWFSSIKMR
ncbi:MULTISPECIES: alpha/beta hydrolase [unclassified Breznakia]|uniref:serine aminopeptidase domain-containing protein n=1 Tax=unclassified Breznakia TaxID=2623764 RepID=UPI0024070712|nr:MULTISPECIES: alpha/beta hydrolase [unclassified Breznakia]